MGVLVRAGISELRRVRPAELFELPDGQPRTVMKRPTQSIIGAATTSWDSIADRKLACGVLRGSHRAGRLDRACIERDDPSLDTLDVPAGKHRWIKWNQLPFRRICFARGVLPLWGPRDWRPTWDS
jgi:hypothetical protein